MPYLSSIYAPPPDGICYPGATIYQFDENGLYKTTYEGTEHFSLTKSFLNEPQRYLRHLTGDQ